jgi:acetyltransferase-like isoleucine patch superfamily enzyme
MIKEIGEDTLIHHSVTTYGVNYVGSQCLILEGVILGYPTVEYLIDLRDHHRFVYEFDYVGTSIDNNAVIRSGSTMYRNLKIGHHFRTGHGVLIRENTHIGNHVMIGSGTIIDADVTIGSNVCIQSRVYISNGCVCEDNVFLGPNCTLLNDRYPIRKGNLEPSRVRRGASLGGNVSVLPGVEIGEGAMVGAGAVVTKDVPPWHLAAGNPARFKKLDESLIVENRII